MAFKNNFKPDIVAGNPPYNRGMDIDFIFDAFKVSKISVTMIVPAKWQTSDENQIINSTNSYGDFRNQLVKHMEELVFYNNCRDIFEIFQVDGITWYTLDKNKTYNLCKVTNKSKDIKEFNSSELRDILHQQSLLNICNEVISHMNFISSFEFPIITYTKRYEVWANTKLSAFDLFNTQRPRLILNISRIIDNNKNEKYCGESQCIFESDSLDECKNFLSWLYSKPVRFLIMANISKLNNIFTKHYFKFVPHETNFKIHYTDDILYKQYGIMQYKELIDKLIKDRNIEEMLKEYNSCN